MRSLQSAVVVILILLASACANDASLLDAAQALEVPAEFQEVSAETLNGFESISRELTFATDLSQNDACELARETFANWAQQPLPEPIFGLLANVCSYDLANPVNHAGVDFAGARVFRAKVNDEFIEDGDAAGGVESIAIFFIADK